MENENEIKIDADGEKKENNPKILENSKIEQKMRKKPKKKTQKKYQKS